MARIIGSRGSVAVVLAVVALAPAGCGGAEGSVDALAGDVAKARDAQAITTLQTALTAAASVRAESGGNYGSGSDDLAQRLQARDPSKRFTTTPSTGPEQVQVLGGGAGPLMLVVRSPSERYLATWDDGSATLYYRGDQPAAFTGQRPEGPGWSSTLPQ
jgi:hypothetical protein